MDRSVELGSLFHANIALKAIFPHEVSQYTRRGNALRAREEPEGVFWATIAAVVVAGTFGVAAVAKAGIDGAIIGMVSSSAVQAAVMLWLLWRVPSTVSVPKSAAAGDVLA